MRSMKRSTSARPAYGPLVSLGVLLNRAGRSSAERSALASLACGASVDGLDPQPASGNSRATAATASDEWRIWFPRPTGCGKVGLCY
jgi:hypothetical protein